MLLLLIPNATPILCTIAGDSIVMAVVSTVSSIVTVLNVSEVI